MKQKESRGAKSRGGSYIPVVRTSGRLRADPLLYIPTMTGHDNTSSEYSRRVRRLAKPARRGGDDERVPREKSPSLGWAGSAVAGMCRSCQKDLHNKTRLSHSSIEIPGRLSPPRMNEK